MVARLQEGRWCAQAACGAGGPWLPRRDAIIAKTDIVERLGDARAAAVVTYITDSKAMTDDYLRHSNRYKCVTKGKKYISRCALATL